MPSGWRKCCAGHPAHGVHLSPGGAGRARSTAQAGQLVRQRTAHLLSIQNLVQRTTRPTRRNQYVRRSGVRSNVPLKRRRRLEERSESGVPGWRSFAQLTTAFQWVCLAKIPSAVFRLPLPTRNGDDYRWGRTRPNPERFNRPMPVRLSPFPKSVGCTIVTSAEWQRKAVGWNFRVTMCSVCDGSCV